MVMKDKMMKELRTDVMILSGRVMSLAEHDKYISNNDKILLNKCKNHLREVHSALLKLEYIPD